MSMPRPTDNWVRLLFAPALLCIAAGIDRNYQTDLWHHLARGRLIVAEGRMIDTDRFSYTVPGRPFIDCNWGWQVVFFELYRLGGLPLLQAVNCAVLVALMALLVGLCQRRGGSALAAALAGVLTVLGLWQQAVLIRPQTTSFLLFVVLYALLEGADRRRWLLGLAPLVLAVWVNCHGGFPVGLGLVGCYVLAALLETPAPRASEDVKRSSLARRAGRALPWAVCLLLCCLATLLNPYGWRVYEYVLHTSGTASRRRIDEWLPPALNEPIGMVWLASILLILILSILLIRAGRRPTVRELVLVCVFLPPTCGSARMIGWWLLATAPILAGQIAAVLPQPRPEEPGRTNVGAAATCGLLALAMVLSLPWFEGINPFFLTGLKQHHRTEDDLREVADRLPRGDGQRRLFTRFAWGEYLGWRLSPDYAVFMDGRIEIYPDDVWVRYESVTRGRDDWQQILDGYGVDWLVLDGTPNGYHAALLAEVQASPHWKEEKEFRRGNVIVFRRKAP
jgi:hypothetical protein